MTSEIQQNRYDQMVRRVAGIIGPGSKVSEVLTELFPMIDVERPPAELLALGGSRLGWQGLTKAAVVAEFSKVQILNPADSGVIVTVTQAIINVATDTTVSVAVNTDVLASISQCRFRDGRLGAAAESTAVIGSGQGAFIPAGLVINVFADTPFTLADENSVAVLSPGTGLIFRNNTANEILTANFFFRERAAEQSELNFSDG